LKSLQQYRIPFTGLKVGKHSFDLEVNEEFFKEYEYSLVKNAKLKVDLELDKQETMLILQFHIVGEIFLTCDVCLSDFPSLVDIKERQIVQFGAADIEDDTEEIIVLDRNEHEVDIAPLIYEYVNLAVPYVSRCEDPGNMQWCDKEMLEKLNKLSGKEQENESEDPRWEALKKIKNN
jgi:uncharacterized metal-binding protein YceD (DUF177 family)